MAKPIAAPSALPDRLGSLTSLRFFAALWVFIHHFSYFVLIPNFSDSVFSDNADYGVDLFFILSGFILSHVYLRQAEAGKFAYWNFILARFARIWPLHAATLAVMVGVWSVFIALHLGTHGFSLLYLLSSVTLTHSWGAFGYATLNVPSWSVSAEWGAYLLFPAFLWASLRLRHRPLAFAALGAALIFGDSYMLRVFGLGDVTDQWLGTTAFRILPEFFFGCGLYALARAYTLPLPQARVGAWLCALAVVFLAASGDFDALVIPLLGVLIFCIAQSEGPSQPGLLNNPAMQYLGETSYALYLVHWPILSLSYDARHYLEHTGDGGHAPFDGMALLLLVAVFVAMACAHHGIERPARDWIRQWGELARRRTQLRA